MIPTIRRKLYLSVLSVCADCRNTLVCSIAYSDRDRGYPQDGRVYKKSGKRM